MQPFILYRQLILSATLCSTVYNMARPPLLRSHLLQYRRLMLLPPHVLFPAHLLSCSAFSSQVTVDPTRYGTGDDMPLAEAITQLSYLEFLQRFGVSIATPQPSQPPVSISFSGCHCADDSNLVTSLTRCPRRRLFKRTRFRVLWLFKRLSMVPILYPWMLLHRRPHPVPCLSMPLRRWVVAQLPRFLLIRLCRLLYAVWVQHDAATQLPLTEFFIGCICSNSLLDRQNLLVSLRHQCTIHMSYLSHRLDLNSQSLPLSLLLNRTCSPTLTALPAMPSSRLSVPTHVGTHPVPTVLSANRSASTALAGTQNPIGSNLRTDAGLFPKPRAVALPWSILGNLSPMDLIPFATVDSDLMHHQFRLSHVQWNPGPARGNPSNIVSAACGRFHAVILREASDNVPDISDQFSVYNDKMGPCDLAQQGHL